MANRIVEREDTLVLVDGLATKWRFDSFKLRHLDKKYVDLVICFSLFGSTWVGCGSRASQNPLGWQCDGDV